MIFQTGLMPPAVDMGIVGHALYFPQLPLKETALEGVHHLLPGFAVTFENGEATEHQYWCPWDYIAPSAASRTMVEGLREVVRSTHRAWGRRSEEHTSELQSLMRISYAVFRLKKKPHNTKD